MKRDNITARREHSNVTMLETYRLGLHEKSERTVVNDDPDADKKQIMCRR